MHAMTIERILVGVDGSGDSRRALGWAAELAGRLDAEVVAVHALGLLEHLEPGADPVPSAPHREESEAAFDLVVVGSRGVGGFDELLLGSTSTQVMHHARVPVTVIPRSWRPTT